MITPARKNISLVLLCHFISAMSTLGLAPFFSLILSEGFQQKPTILVGFLYVLPTLLTAISAPLWGKLADKVNKKSAILRAQLGLSISFFIAAFSKDYFALFVFSLCLQGLLGGTLAAANAYLAKTTSKQKLSQILNLTQLSARSAFLLAPIVIGFTLHAFSVFSIYALLGTITLLSSILILCYLENDKPPIDEERQEIRRHKAPNNLKIKPKEMVFLPYGLLLLGTFVLSFSLVATFPYFLLFIQQYLKLENVAIAGMLFSLPHAMYLLFLLPCQRINTHFKQPLKLLSLSLIVLGMSLIAQAYSQHILILIILRVTMGVSMTSAYISLNNMIANLPFEHKEGRVFAWLDSFNKYGGVAAGVLAGLSFSVYGLKAPFILAALSLFSFCAFYQLYLCIFPSLYPKKHKELI